MTVRCFVAAIVCATGVAMAPAAFAQSAPAGNADNGKNLYAADGCYQCHGYVGQGGGVAGPRLAPTPIAFDAFEKQLREPRNEMPPYTDKVLSEKDAADIYAYLQTIPKPPAVKDIAILNQ